MLYTFIHQDILPLMTRNRVQVTGYSVYMFLTFL